MQELCFEHLVVRNSQGYSFGTCTGIQLQLDGGEVVASKDGLVYEPFKECRLLWDSAGHILERKGTASIGSTAGYEQHTTARKNENYILRHSKAESGL